MPLAGLSWMIALGPGGILWLLAPTLWPLRLPVGSRIGGSRSTTLSLLSLVSASGLRRCLAQGSLCRFGLLAGLILLTGPLPLLPRLFRTFGIVYREKMGTVPPDVILALRSAFDANCVDRFWSVWSASAEAKLLLGLFLVGVLCRSGDASLEAVGGGAASKLYRVSHGHDVASAQYFVNSSLAPVLLFPASGQAGGCFS